VVAEVGSDPTGGDKAAWILGMMNAVPESYPNIKAVAYFHSNQDGAMWQIDMDSSSVAAFRQLAADPRWQARMSAGVANTARGEPAAKPNPADPSSVDAARYDVAGRVLRTSCDSKARRPAVCVLASPMGTTLSADSRSLALH
jgi:hypothetical protein